MRWLHARAMAVALSLTAASPAAATPPLQAARVDERLGRQVPRDLVFRDQRGVRVRLGELLGPEPTLLVLGYYRCPMLCGLVQRAAATLRRELTAPVRLLTVSIDPEDDPDRAAARRAAAFGGAAPDAAWPFLVGDATAVRRLAGAVGFRYQRDAASGQYAHPAVAIVLTPSGRVASYLYGTDLSPSRADAALRAAAAERTTAPSPLERVLLRCWQYVPALRRHADALATFLRGGALVTLLAFGLLLVRVAHRRGGGP